MQQNTSRRHRHNEPRRASRLHKITVTLCAAALGAVALWGVAYAHDGHRAAHAWDPDGPGFGGPLKMMAAELDLTEAQKEKIQQILQSAHKERQALTQQMRGMRSDLHDLIKAGAYSDDQARVIAEQLAPVFVELTVLMSRTMNDVRAVLTPEQQTKAAKWHDLHPMGFGRHGPVIHIESTPDGDS